jgi:hypothetical protein
MKKKQQPLNFSSTVLNHNQALLVKIITPDLNQPARERVSGLQRRVLINWPRDERRRESGGRRGEVWCRKPTLEMTPSLSEGEQRPSLNDSVATHK